MHFHVPNWMRRKSMDTRTEERKSTSNANAGLFMLAGEMKNSEHAGRNYQTLSKDGFTKNPVAYRAMRMVSEAAASIPWLLYNGDRELEEHALLKLLRHPQNQMNSVYFFEALYGHLMLAGNAYIEPIFVLDELRELHLWRPDRVSIILGPDGWPYAYDYRANKGKIKRVILSDNRHSILHLKLFNPLDDHNGFAPLSAAGTALDLHNSAGKWNKHLLDNSARPSGALVFQPKEGGNLSDDQYERLKQELTDGYSGALHAGRPLILEGGLDWKSMGMTPKDMDFMEAKNSAARDIALAICVPPMLLGIPGDNTFSNYQEANRAFYRLTVLPLLQRTLASFSNWLCSPYNGKLHFEADLDKVTALTGERDALWARVGAANFLSDEEKRQAVGY